MSILVFVEHANGVLSSVLPRLLTAAHRLAEGRGDEVCLLLAGADCAAAAAVARSHGGVGTVRCIEAPHYADGLVENLAMPIAQMAAHYSHLVFAASALGKGLAPRVAAMLDVAPVTDVVEILAADTFVRPIYAGNVLTTVRSAEPVKVLTVRPSAFAPAQWSRSDLAPLQSAPKGPDMGVARLLERCMASGHRPSLENARVVVAGGRGLGSAQAFEQLLHPLADRLGAALGATRAAVDAGFAPHDWQVGQTGKIIAPELYIAVGISGAAQHLAGIRSAKTIVAIDRDPQCPLFQYADYHLVGEAETLLPALMVALDGL